MFDSTSKPTLEGLAYVLRNPDTWPPGFKWDFSHCHKCAMGLSRIIWGDNANPVDLGPILKYTAKLFDIDVGDTIKIFYRPEPLKYDGDYTPSDLQEITPEIVARQIDTYLAGKRHTDVPWWAPNTPTVHAIREMGLATVVRELELESA